MGRFTEFLKTAFIGGVVVVLPGVIMAVVFIWLFNLINNNIEPIAHLITLGFGLSDLLAKLTTLALIIAICFLIGLVVETRIGSFFRNVIEKELLMRFPGYITVKDLVGHFADSQQTTFSSVALVRPYGNDTLVTAFITDDRFPAVTTVFIPTGPNPTSGNIMHLPKENVYILDSKVERGIKTVIGCGAGSKELLDSYKKLHLAPAGTSA